MRKLSVIFSKEESCSIDATKSFVVTSVKVQKKLAESKVQKKLALSVLFINKSLYWYILYWK